MNADNIPRDILVPSTPIKRNSNTTSGQRLREGLLSNVAKQFKNMDVAMYCTSEGACEFTFIYKYSQLTKKAYNQIQTIKV